MPNVKITNLSGGLYRSDTPEQIPEISWTDLVNMDCINDSIQTRDGYRQASTTPIPAGCLQLGYKTPTVVGGPFLKVRSGTFGPQATTHSAWGAFLYADMFDTTPSNQHLLTLTDAASSRDILKLYWNTSSLLTANVQPNASDGVVTLATSTTPLGAGNLYGVTITPSTTTQFTMRLYDHTGVAATTIVSTTASFEKVDTIYFGADRQGVNALQGYMGELIITKDETVSSTVGESFNVIPPGFEAATTSRIAYYPLQKDLDDAWGLSPSFDDPPVFETGAGLSVYHVEDEILTSPQAVNEILNTKSAHVDTYNQDNYLYFTTGTSAYMNSLNPAVGSGYTLVMDFLPIQMKSTSTSFVLFDGSRAGPSIRMEYADKDHLKLAYRHTINPTDESTVSTTIPTGVPSKLMFDYNFTADTTAVQKIYRNFSEVKSGTWAPTGTSTSAVGALRFFKQNTSVTHSNHTRGKDIEFFMSGFLGYNTSVATTWTKKPPATMGRVTAYKTKKVIEHVQTGTRISKDIRGRGETLVPTFHSVATKVQVPYTKIEAGAEPIIHDPFYLPSFGSVDFMYLFNDFSGYENAQTGVYGAHRNGLLINAKDPDNTNESTMVGYNMSAPAWVIDRNDAGLATTGFLDTDYMDEFESAFSFLPTKSNLGDQLLLGSNMNLVNATTGVTHCAGHTFKWGRKSVGKMRGIMYGNSLYVHNEHKMFRFDGRRLYPTDIPTPTTPLTVTATTEGTGLNGAYMYTYTYTNKNGVESGHAPIVSSTVHFGKFDISLKFQDSRQGNILRETVDYVNIYRNKGSVGVSTTVVDNNGTYLYLRDRIPYRSLLETGTAGTIISDKAIDSILGKELLPQENVAVPSCKYSTLYSESGIFTGDPEAPNHYYISAPELPDLLDYFGEFRTEDGEPNSAVAPLGSGFLVFKNNSRKYVRGGDETRAEEYSDGGCVSHDSLVNLGIGVIGLGDGGFFFTNGSVYRDITTSSADGRPISSVQKDVDSWSLATKQAAHAVYHDATSRYICYVDNKFYVYQTKRQTWTKYEDFVGLPVVYKGDFYIFKKGWLWKEYNSQGHVGTTAHVKNIVLGSKAEVKVSSTTALPTSSEVGLPVYIDNEMTWVRDISASGTTYTLKLHTASTFDTAKKMYLGVMQAYAETKNFEARTPSKNKFWKQLALEHDAVTGGEIEIRFARDSGDIDNDYNHFVGESDRGRIMTWLRCYGKNIRLRYNMRDGKQHTLKSYTIEYDQKQYGY